MAMGRQKDGQGDLMVSWSEMPRSPGHVFYDRLWTPPVMQAFLRTARNMRSGAVVYPASSSAAVQFAAGPVWKYADRVQFVCASLGALRSKSGFPDPVSLTFALTCPPTYPHPRRLPALRRSLRRGREPGSSPSSSSAPRRCAPSCWPAPPRRASSACAPASRPARAPSSRRAEPPSGRQSSRP